jgi:hypothetical protein
MDLLGFSVAAGIMAEATMRVEEILLWSRLLPPRHI